MGVVGVWGGAAGEDSEELGVQKKPGVRRGTGRPSVGVGDARLSCSCHQFFLFLCSRLRLQHLHNFELFRLQCYEVASQLVLLPPLSFFPAPVLLVSSLLLGVDARRRSGQAPQCIFGRLLPPSAPCGGGSRPRAPTCRHLASRRTCGPAGAGGLASGAPWRALVPMMAVRRP
jgi:hypothetical protein